MENHRYHLLHRWAEPATTRNPSLLRSKQERAPLTRRTAMNAEPGNLYTARVREAVMTSIVQCSIVEVDSVRVAHIRVAELLDAFTPIIASMIATSEEASTEEGAKRILRRFARRLEGQLHEFQDHVARNGSPFGTA